MARPVVHGIKEIASRANVSTATVSRVVNNHPGVKEEVRAQIIELMRDMECPTRAAGRLTHIMTMISSDRPVIEGFLSEVMSGVAQYSFEHNISIEFAFLPRARRGINMLRYVRQRRCDGFMGIFMGERIRQLEELTKNGVPVMLIGERTEYENAGYLMVDSYAGAKEVVGYLVKLGHEKIAMLANSGGNSPDLSLRVRGYQDALRQSGLSYGLDHIVEHIPAELTQISGYRQTMKLLEKHPDVTAIFAATDEMAFGAIQACREKGVRVPQDISIAGFDDNKYSACWNPGLTTFRQPVHEFGFEAARYLDMYLNESIHNLPQKVVQGSLIVRESCAPRRAR